MSAIFCWRPLSWRREVQVGGLQLLIMNAEFSADKKQVNNVGPIINVRNLLFQLVTITASECPRITPLLTANLDSSSFSNVIFKKYTLILYGFFFLYFFIFCNTVATLAPASVTRYQHTSLPSYLLHHTLQIHTGRSIYVLSDNSKTPSYFVAIL